MSVPARRRLVLVLVAILGALAMMSVPASAQIYAVRDEHGTLILSDKPLGPGAATYDVPGSRGSAGDTAAVRTTRRMTHARPTMYDDIIDVHATSQRLRPALVRAVVQVESGFNQFARSNKGAMGLMQLMPATARVYGVTDPYDPEQNIGAGTAYLRDLLDRFEGNEELALAAYNAGPGAVERYGQAVPPYRETRDYVRKVAQRTTVLAERAPRNIIYRTWEEIDGRRVPKFSNVRPSTGEYDVVKLR
jgi:hypothetical protein